MSATEQLVLNIEQQAAAEPESFALEYLVKNGAPARKDDEQTEYWNYLQADTYRGTISAAGVLACVAYIQRPQYVSVDNLTEQASRLTTGEPVIVHANRNGFSPMPTESGVLRQDAHLRVFGWGGLAGLVWSLPFEGRQDVQLASLTRPITVGETDIADAYHSFLDQRDVSEGADSRQVLMQRVRAAATVSKLGLTDVAMEFTAEIAELTEKLARLNPRQRSSPDYAKIIDESMAFDQNYVCSLAKKLMTKSDDELIGKPPSILNILTSKPIANVTGKDARQEIVAAIRAQLELAAHTEIAR